MNIAVSIPVTLGGYTGQRDQWEQHAQDYKVTYDPELKLVTLDSGGSIQRRISFNLEELTEAVQITERHRAPAPKPEVDRSKCKHRKKHPETRHFSDDSYDSWDETVFVCDACGEVFRGID